MNIKLDHTFFPPPLSIAKLDDKVVEEIIAKLNDRLSIERDRYSPYPEEMLKRWKDLAFQKMVQNEFANHRIRLLEIELDQCRADKLADSKLVEQLYAKNLALEHTLASKCEQLNEQAENLNIAFSDIETLRLQDQKHILVFGSKLEEIRSLASNLESFSKTFNSMHEILNARIKYAIERIGIVKIVHQGSLCKKLKKLEILKSELDQMRVDRKLLVRQLLKKQDEEVLSEGFIGYSSSKLIDQSFDRLQLLESLSDALLEL